LRVAHVTNQGGDVVRTLAERVVEPVAQAVVAEREALEEAGPAGVIELEGERGSAVLAGGIEVVDAPADLVGIGGDRVVGTQDGAQLCGRREAIPDIRGTRGVAVVVVLVLADGVELVGAKGVVEAIGKPAVQVAIQRSV